MADAFNRFHPGSQYFYQNQHSTHPRNLHHRNGSPVHTASRGLFQPNADTPSPNRSPGTHSPAHNPYSMFNHNNHRQTHGMLNGSASHQTYQNQLNLHKGYQSQNHNHQSHHLNNQHQDHSGHGGHSTFANHQHTVSTSTLSNNTPHFTPVHLQNGISDNSTALPKPPNEHWAEQLREYTKLKVADKPHYYARTISTASRTPASVPSTAGSRTDADEHGQRRGTLSSDEPSEAGQWDAMDMCGHGLKSMGASIFRFYPNLRKIFFHHNKLTWLPPQIGQMHSLTILDLSFNDLTILPPEIGMLTNLKRLLLYENQLEDLPTEIGHLYQLEMLGIEGNPMRLDLKERIVEHGTQELVRFMREQAEPATEPLDREWISLADDADTESEKFKILNWNTLCNRGASQGQFGYASAEVLSWERRSAAILKELHASDADIITLQEIDIENYNEFFRPTLANENYKGVFWPKSRAQTMAEKEARMVDGCATFFRNDKFILLDKHLISYSREAINRPDMKGEHDIYNRVMPRDHIAVVLFLENRQTGSRLIVSNTHLAWEGWFADVKIIQVAILMEQLALLAEKYSKWPACTDKEPFKYAKALDDEDWATNTEPAPSMKYDDGTQIPMLVCGDFNSTPDSGVLELITQGSLSNAHAELGDHKYGDFTRNGMQHPFHLKSTYAHIAHWPFTNYTASFREELDYIFYGTHALQVTGLLGELDEEYLRRVPGFPNHHFPSDHVLLCAEFAVKGRKERKQVEADFGPQKRDGRH